MKNVIVTGATGFVGKTLVREIRTRFPEANVVELGTSVVDLSDMHATAAWMRALNAFCRWLHTQGDSRTAPTPAPEAGEAPRPGP